LKNKCYSNTLFCSEEPSEKLKIERTIAFFIDDNTRLYVPPGDPGTDVDIWLVIKPGMWAPSDVVGGYDVLFDNVGVYPVE
jgi:hypothetical protein